MDDEDEVDAAEPRRRFTAGFKVWVAVLVGATAISAVTLAWVEAENGRRGDAALIDATRQALAVFVDLGASGPRYQFELDSIRRSTTLDARSTARTATVSTEDLEAFRVALGLATADNAASRRLLEVSQHMQALPDGAEGLDERASQALRVRSEEDVEGLYEAQAAALHRADVVGVRQLRALYGLSLVAIAASLVGLAGLLGSGRGGFLAIGSAAGMLVLALGVGFSGYLT